MDRELTEEEREREEVRKLVALQKVVGQIVLKWRTLLISTFAALSIGFTLFIVWHYATSNHRYDASTRLSYMPRKVARVENLNDKQLFSILERPSLKRRVGQRLSMPREERECLGIDLEITQERKPTNIYTLKARAPGKLAAITKVNTYAKVLIDEYRDYRMRDLDALRESIGARKERVRERLSELDGEETIVKGKSGVASPVETLTAINSLLSDQRRDLAMLNAQILNEEVKRRRLEETVGGFGETVSRNSAAIREKFERLAAIDAEIANLRTIYTDLNPKVMGKLEDRDAFFRDYENFIAENGLEGKTLEEVALIEKAVGELAEIQMRLEVLAESRRSLEQWIKDNEERSAKLTGVIPALERLNGQRLDLESTMRSLDDQISEIEYLQMAMASDLTQIERSGGAGDSDPLRSKNFIMSIAAALFCTLSLGVWIVVLELLFGKVWSKKELAAYDEFLVLGSIPAAGALPESEEKDILGVAALRFCKADLPKSVVLVCRLPGVPPQDAFSAALDWSLTMSGQRAFTLEIVKSADFVPPEGATSIISTFRKDTQGWLPIENRYMLVTSELEMLQADLAALKEEFDVVFITMPDGVRRGGSFFSQLLGVCDSVLLMVGARATPRSWLVYARQAFAQAGKPVMALLTGVKAKIAKREMEEANG
ncbi:MAG: hypothetical protein IJP66_10075, partial [Kiritimatiellae bacterium]|nr:hypothetical protein [Kiritimatiellia bacterium]